MSVAVILGSAFTRLGDLQLTPEVVSTPAGEAVLHRVQARAQILRSDWFSGVEGQFDLVVANPPYIALDEWRGLEDEVRRHEPELALTDGGDGLGAYRQIAAGLDAHLAPGGRALMEIGPTQAAQVRELLESAGFSQIGVIPDLDGRDRVVHLRKP